MKMDAKFVQLTLSHNGKNSALNFLDPDRDPNHWNFPLFHILYSSTISCFISKTRKIAHIPHVMVKIPLQNTCIPIMILIAAENQTSCAGGCHNMPPPPASWPLTLKVVSESRVTWPTSVPILVFLGLSALDLGPMYATDRHQADRRQTRIIA